MTISLRELENHAGVTIPRAIARAMGAGLLELDTVGESGAVVAHSARCYIKIERTGGNDEVVGERRNLEWLQDKVPVPELIAYASNGDAHFLVTEKLEGRAIYEDRENATPIPDRVVALAEALKVFHALPTENVPDDRRLDNRLMDARARIEIGHVFEEDFSLSFSGKGAEAVFKQCLEERPNDADCVVCHGDYCLPNVLFDGCELVGFIDVGWTGLADRYQDLALATWSLGYNFPDTDYAPLFLKSYGIDPIDAEKLSYYKMLDQLF